MVSPVVVIDCVGLTPSHLGSDTPNLSELAGKGWVAPLTGVTPAVTTTAQTTMLTGVGPDVHGIVGNGWYFRELGEIWFWRQSQGLVQAPHFWQADPKLKVLKHFWWYAMNTDVCATVTPRPAYHHDGRKSPDFYAHPYDLKDRLSAAHGGFPLFQFWGPGAGIASTDWIAASFCTAFDAVKPDVGLVYLPHLDYDLQRFGPTGPHLAANLRALDQAAGTVIAHARSRGAKVLVVSEYGLEAVDRACFPNIALREAGLVSVVRNATGELLDPGASRAFAVADHQIAHIYCADANSVIQAAFVLRALPGIGRVLVGDERAAIGLAHARSGEIVILAERGCWFGHDYWLDDAAKPDFATSVEIHKKPGYDPRELVLDPRGGKFRAAMALLRKKLGFRYVMNVISNDPSLVRGSHGLSPVRPEHGPLVIASDAAVALESQAMTDVPRLIRALR